MVQVAIMGYGTIGSGVAEILAQNAEQITNGCGQDVALKYVLDLRDFPGSPVEDKIVHDFSGDREGSGSQRGSRDHGRTESGLPVCKGKPISRQACGNLNKALVAAMEPSFLPLRRRRT